MKLRLLAPLLCALLPATAGAATFNLNFADKTFPNFGSTELSVDFDSVATVNGDVVNARLSAEAPWAQNNTGNNESEANSVQFNAKRGETIKLSLSLFDDAIGDGYTTAFDPGVSYGWSVTFFDIDGNDTTWDQILIRTPGQAAVAQDTRLGITPTAEGVLFSGEDTVNNVSNDVTSGALSADQQRNAVRYSVENTSSIAFDYTAVTTVPSTSGRNLIFNGGSFVIDDPDTFAVAPVPLPAGAPLLIAALGAVVCLRRRKAAA